MTGRQFWRFHVCECGAQTPIGQPHTCHVQGQRLAAELIEFFMMPAPPKDDWQTFIILPFDGSRDIKHHRVTDGIGLLWLYRIAFRIRSRMDGLEKYKDRAELARRVCTLMGETQDVL